MASPLEDPWVAAQVEAAIAPYAAALGPSALAFMRAQLAETLASDPRARRLMRRAMPLDVDATAELCCDGAEGDAADADSVPGRARKAG